MPFVVLIVLLGICIIGVIACNKLLDEDHDFLGLITGIFCIVCAIVTIVAACNAVEYGLYLANPDAHKAKAAEERETYIIMLDKMDRLAGQDVTASDTYLEVYENVMKFNSYVRYAQKWVGTWGEGIFGDPSYAGLEVIPIKGLD